MDCPLVTIVLPVSNGERYLRQSIESCLSQSYSTLELILVNDGSTDSTPAICEEYLKVDPRVRLLSHAGNRGLPQALNTGFAVAAGQYLTWTSADNYYRQHAIAKMLEVLETGSKADFVYSDLTILDPQDRPVERWAAGEMQELVFVNRVGACFLYRRKVQEELGKYDEDLFLAEDYDFWLRVSTRFRMVHIHEDLYGWRKHPSSLTMRFADRCMVISDRCLERNLPQLTWASRPDKAKAYLMLARRAQLHGEWGRAWRLVLSAFRLSPSGSFIDLTRRALRLRGPATAGLAR